MPCIAHFSVAWFPVEERGRVGSVAHIGVNVSESNIGSENQNSILLCIFQVFASLSMYAVGLVIHVTGRWDIMFYGLSAINILCCILFVRYLIEFQ